MNTNTIESIFADIDNKAVQGTIELYKEQYSAADQRHRETISAALDGYTKALEDLQIIRPGDFMIIREYVETEDEAETIPEKTPGTTRVLITEDFYTDFILYETDNPEALRKYAQEAANGNTEATTDARIIGTSDELLSEEAIKAADEIIYLSEYIED